MAKKVVSIFMIASMLLCLVACSNTHTKKPNANPTQSSNTVNDDENKNDEEKWVLVSYKQYGGQTETENKKYFYDKEGRKIRTDKNNLLGGPASTIYQYIVNDKGELLHCYEYEIEFLKEDNEFYEFHNRDYDGYTYDDKGNLLSKIEGMGNDSCYYEYKYDENGNILQEAQYKSGILIETTKYEYSGNALIGKWVRNEKESIETIYTYGADEKIISVEMQSDDGSMSRSEKYKNGIIESSDTKTAKVSVHKTFDEKGALLTSVSTDGKKDEYERIYDANGNVSYEKLTSSGRTGEYEYLNGTEEKKYAYDEHNRKTSENTKKNGVTVKKISWEYGEDEHSYKQISSQYNDFVSGATWSTQIDEYNFLPLKKCLEQQEKDIVGVYKQTDIDTGAELFVGKTLVADCYFGVMMYKNDDNSFYREPWLIYEGEYYFMNTEGATSHSEIVNLAKGSFEFENGNIVISNYNDTSGYHQFSGHY